MGTFSAHEYVPAYMQTIFSADNFPNQTLNLYVGNFTVFVTRWKIMREIAHFARARKKEDFQK